MIIILSMISGSWLLGGGSSSKWSQILSHVLTFFLLFLTQCIQLASSYISIEGIISPKSFSSSKKISFPYLSSTEIHLPHATDTRRLLFSSPTIDSNSIFSFNRRFDFEEDITSIFQQQVKEIFLERDSEDDEDVRNDVDDHDEYLAEGIVRNLQIQHLYDPLKQPIKGFGISDSEKPIIINHYTCPPISVEIWRKRYGRRKTFWGEWSSRETRQFYKTQLPKALQVDGALGLTLEERAKLASEARYALRLYTRERCHLPGRIFAKVYDGFRHWIEYGTWNDKGMTWPEVKLKYSKQAIERLGENATENEIIEFVYHKIVEKSCSTNHMIDEIAETTTRLNIFQQIIQRLSMYRR
mmetsp:Transcript_14995/g.16233  ORF Transcript_14995/g.16233 Transcript_14995/m.16233 type:complete len:355 (-) Transcript_14995:353-1417(-)